MTEPFAISTISCEGSGRLGLCSIPGRTGNLKADLAEIKKWNPALVVSMTEQAEMNAAGVGELGQRLKSLQIPWSHLPIRDFGPPEGESLILWPELGKKIHAILNGRGNVLLHCKGGKGRSGMVLLRILIERGGSPKHALQRLRRIRPGAVETEAQFLWATNV